MGRKIKNYQTDRQFLAAHWSLPRIKVIWLSKSCVVRKFGHFAPLHLRYNWKRNRWFWLMDGLGAPDNFKTKTHGMSRRHCTPEPTQSSTAFFVTFNGRSGAAIFFHDVVIVISTTRCTQCSLWLSSPPYWPCDQRIFRKANNSHSFFYHNVFLSRDIHRGLFLRSAININVIRQHI